MQDILNAPFFLRILVLAKHSLARARSVHNNKVKSFVIQCRNSFCVGAGRYNVLETHPFNVTRQRFAP